MTRIFGKYEKAKNIIIAILLFLSIGQFVFLMGCKSFEPYENKNQPQSCNDNITMMRLIVKTNGVFDKSGTVAFLTLLSLSYVDCKNDRVKIIKHNRFNACKKMIYGNVLGSKEENYKKYSEFLECKGNK